MFLGSIGAGALADRAGRKTRADVHRRVLRRVLAGLGVLLGRRVARRLPLPDVRGSRRDDRRRGDLHQRDLPGGAAREVPGVRDRHRHLRHARDEPHRELRGAALRLVVAPGLPVGRARPVLRVLPAPHQGVPEVAREPRRARARRRGAARDRAVGRRREGPAARARRGAGHSSSDRTGPSGDADPDAAPRGGGCCCAGACCCRRCCSASCGSRRPSASSATRAGRRRCWPSRASASRTRSSTSPSPPSAPRSAACSPPRSPTASSASGASPSSAPSSACAACSTG